MERQYGNPGMHEKLKQIMLSLFWPVGLSRPVSQAAQQDQIECRAAWRRGEQREPRIFPGDIEARKENWRVVGPSFKNYFVRWGGIFLLMIGAGVGPFADVNSDSMFGAWFGSLLITLTLISGAMTAVHGLCYRRYLAFKAGKAVWK
jgi:hypothetical protein